jgi:hypothetical protein
MYSGDGGSSFIGGGLERKSSIKSISRIGDRTLEIIETDSDSSLGSFGSIDSPKTAWKKNHKPQASEDDDDDTTSVMSTITDSSVASVIQAVNKATELNGGRGEVDGYFRNPAVAASSEGGTLTSASGAIYGFSLRRRKELQAPKQQGSSSPPMLISAKQAPETRRPSFRQYNATVTSRQSHISVDSLASPLSSLTMIGLQSKLGDKSNNIDSSAMTTLTRNRGPRPAYSDANMQHSLGYLP